MLTFGGILTFFYYDITPKSLPGHHSVQLLDVSHKVRLLAVRPGQPLVELLELILEACEDD